MIISTGDTPNTFAKEYIDMQSECMGFGHICRVSTAAEHKKVEESGGMGVFLDPSTKNKEQVFAEICENLTIRVFVDLEDWELFSRITRATKKNVPMCMPIKRAQDFSTIISVPHVYDFSDHESAIDPDAIDWDLATLFIVREEQVADLKKMRAERADRLVPIVQKYNTESELLDFTVTESEGSFINFFPNEDVLDRFMVAFIQGYEHPQLMRNITLDASKIPIGVLAINGEFLVHLIEFEESSLAEHIQVILVNQPEDLMRCRGLLVPGGWSNHMIRLIDSLGLEKAIRDFQQSGKPITGCCAGGIAFGAENFFGCDNRKLMALADVGVVNNQKQGLEEITNLLTGEKELRCFSDGPVFCPLSDKLTVLANDSSERALVVEDNNVIVSAIHKGPLIHDFLIKKTMEAVINQSNQLPA